MWTKCPVCKVDMFCPPEAFDGQIFECAGCKAELIYSWDVGFGPPYLARKVKSSES